MTDGIRMDTKGLRADIPAAADAAGDHSLPARLAATGVDRRTFLKFCAGVTATLALPSRFAPRVAAALAKVDRSRGGVAGVPGLRGRHRGVRALAEPVGV